MNSTNDEEILITFDELKQLQIEDISTCVDKYNALSICEKSAAPPNETFSLWVQKILKAYDLKSFSSTDWHKIVKYLEKVLNNFVESFNPSNDDSLKHLNLWWLDTQDLLKWLDSVINSLDICVLSLILTYVLDIIIKTCKFTDKRNFAPILSIQKQIINTVNNFMLPLPITDSKDFENLHRVLSSICDVGLLISSTNFKISVDTWTIVAKLSEKSYRSYNAMPNIQNECTKNIKWIWHDKAIFGLIKELTIILKTYLEEDTSNTDNNILIVSQFYLKLLKVVINHFCEDEDFYKFPAIKEFFELYSLLKHQPTEEKKSGIDVYLNKPLNIIFSQIYKQDGITEYILQHLKNDVENFSSCDLVLNYLKINIEYCAKDLSTSRQSVRKLLDVYDILFEGPLIFIDGEMYNNILEYYVTLTIQDSTNELHEKLCQYVIDSSWIKTFASAEILMVYYSFLNKRLRPEEIIPCLEFWLKFWNKLSSTNANTTRHNKFLVQNLLKVILNKMPDSLLHLYSKKYPIIEIIRHSGGKESTQQIQNSLYTILNEMQSHKMDNLSYNNLITLLEIFAWKPECFPISLKQNLFEIFKDIFLLPPEQIHRFRNFLNKCFRIFINFNDELLNNNLLKFLTDHLSYIENIWSVNLIEFLLKQRPQSKSILQSIKSSELLQIVNLIDDRSLTKYKNQKIDLKIFQNLNKNNYNDIQQLPKKPRLAEGECNFSNIKFILNEMNLNSQQLLNINVARYDHKDYELLNCIKNNIDKCLTK